jgi:hypothetical protein
MSNISKAIHVDFLWKKRAFLIMGAYGLKLENTSDFSSVDLLSSDFHLLSLIFPLSFKSSRERTNQNNQT